MKKKHPEHVNHERWLVSYADFITLLFAFFVVLFASGQSDKRKQVKLAQSMQAAFRYTGIFDPHSRTPPIADDENVLLQSMPSPLSLPVPSLASVDPGTTSAAHIRAVVKSEMAQAKTAQAKLSAAAITVHSSPDGLVVSLHEAGFFASGSADIREESLPVLSALAAALPRQPIRVEGHTDNVPIHTALFASNWELSTARAATITRLLLAQNAADATQISAAGYAEFHPIADNMTENGRAKNRRVDIVLLTPPDPDAKTQ